MKEKYAALIENKTWDLVDFLSGKKALPCKFVFKTKQDAKEKIVRKKARLVIKSFAQKKGIGYDETFSSVVRFTSTPYLLAVTVEYDLDIDQLDAVSAYKEI